MASKNIAIRIREAVGETIGFDVDSVQDSHINRCVAVSQEHAYLGGCGTTISSDRDWTITSVDGHV